MFDQEIIKPIHEEALSILYYYENQTEEPPNSHILRLKKRLWTIANSEVNKNGPFTFSSWDSYYHSWKIAAEHIDGIPPDAKHIVAIHFANQIRNKDRETMNYVELANIGLYGLK